MQFQSGGQERWNEGLKNNEDPYGHRVYTYAEDWANLLEKRIPEGADEGSVMRILVDHASEDSHTADTDGITGFMYGASVSVLSHVWKWGEQLRRWHNLETQIGNEGEKANESGGVLNPAILNISNSAE